MPDYVRSYIQLEDRATGAESKADEYRRRGEDNRWEQCRIAYDAIASGAHNQTTFAREVGKSPATIRRQQAAWANWGSSSLAKRPAYAEAIAGADGLTVSSETDRKQISNARTVLKDRALTEELLADPDLCARLEDALLNAHERRSKDKKPAKPLNERWAAWANRATTLVVGGAKLADETDDPDNLDAHAALGYMVYERIVERQLDAEIRSLMDTADVE